MSDSLKGNIWAERNLPALEYCNIRRAADLLNCTVSDILHWAEIEAINLCLKIDWMPSAIDFNIGMEQAEPWFEQQINSKVTLNPRAVLSKKSCFYLGVNTVNPLEADIKYNFNGQEIGFNIKKNEKGQICGHAEGFWNFFVFGYNEMVYHELNSCGSITFDFLDLRIVAADRTDEPEIYLTPCSFVEDDLFYCDSEDKSGYEKIKLPSLITITLEDLFITRSQLEYLYSRRGEVLAREGANKQVISSQADSLIKISRIWADFFPANNRISLFRLFFPPFLALFPVFTEISPTDVSFGPPETGWPG